VNEGIRRQEEKDTQGAEDEETNMKEMRWV